MDLVRLLLLIRDGAEGVAVDLDLEDISLRREDATKGENTSIYSPRWSVKWFGFVLPFMW